MCSQPATGFPTSLNTLCLPHASLPTDGFIVLKQLFEFIMISYSVWIQTTKQFLFFCRLVPCLYIVKDIDRLHAYHSRGFIGYVVLKIWCHASRLVASYQPRSKLNIGKNMAAARPGSGIIHEPRSVTSDLQSSSIGPHNMYMYIVTHIQSYMYTQPNIVKWDHNFIIKWLNVRYKLHMCASFVVWLCLLLGSHCKCLIYINDNENCPFANVGDLY